MQTLKPTIMATTIVLLLASSLQAFQSSDWIKFAPAGGGLSVTMPAEPKEMEITPVKDFTSHTFGLVADNAVYVICYGDYAPGVHLDVNAELIANRDNFLKPLGGSATSTTKIELDGRPGIEFTGESSKYNFASRVFLSGNRVYQVAIAVEKGVDGTGITSRFLKSFAFVSTTQGDHAKP